MARRRVFKRRDLASFPDLPWVSECCSCTWQQIHPTHARAFGRALRHTACAGFQRG